MQKVSTIIKTIKTMRTFFQKPQGAAYLFILPALLVLAVFVFVPLVSAVVISFTDLNIFLTAPHWVGLQNFIAIFHDDRFYNALKNSVYFLLEVPLQIVVGLLVAVYLSTNTIFRRFLRSVYFLPTVCSLTAMGIVWSFLIDPQIGTIPYYLTELGFPHLQFLHDTAMAMPMVIMMTVWKNFGMTMVILVAGIQAIPQSYYEAAKIDGATKVKQFFTITIPLLLPSLSFCIITNTIGSLQVFDQIFVMTQGGPIYSTETLVMYIYDVGFTSEPFQLGYASAIAVVLFVIIMVIALLMNNYFNRKETYGD
jgi:ABC-type sugar transport systems, permease components